jgi:carnitine-CoA ligase
MGTQLAPGFETDPRVMSHFGAMSAWTLLQARANVSGDDPAIIWQPFDAEPRTWTFREWADESAAVAAGLSKRGIKEGDRVIIHLENCPEFLIAWFACAALGAVAVTTNTRSAPDELSYYAKHSRARGIITQPRFAELSSVAVPDAEWIVVTDHDGGVPGEHGADVDRFADLVATDSSELVTPAPDPSRPVSVQYTSGTTSRPKGVLWTHANALWGGKVSSAHQGLQPDDRHLVYLPLFHTNSFSYSMLPSLWVGAAIVLIPKWSTSRFWDISQRHGCTRMMIIGLSARAILSMPASSENTYRGLLAGITAGPWESVMGATALSGFGMTETITLCLTSNRGFPDRPGSMGRPSPEYQIAVVRADGSPVEPEETGELLVRGIRGLSMFYEYLDNPEANAAAFDEDGWFHTGDLVTLHADGCLTYRDRLKDVLRVGAENVAASEVERVIAAVPGVVESAVVARPDDSLDEVPVAFVVAPEGADIETKVIEACKSQLADFKVPRAVYRIGAMPRSTLNKISKMELRTVATPDANRAKAELEWAAAALKDPSGDAS